jgi:hypothetical protein
LPGIAQKDILIEWQDSNTISIAGRIEYTQEEDTHPNGLVEEIELQKLTQNEAKGYHYVTVEDESIMADAIPDVAAGERELLRSRSPMDSSTGSRSVLLASLLIGSPSRVESTPRTSKRA